MSRPCVLRAAVAISCIVANSMTVGGQTPKADQDPRTGTWKLNLEESRFAAGGPRMQQRRVESRPDGFIVFTQVGLDAQGNPTFTQTTYKLDGREYPEYTQNTLSEFAATGAKPNTNTYRLADAYTVKITRIDATGKVTGTSSQVISQDGRRLTVTSGLGIQVWDKE